MTAVILGTSTMRILPVWSPPRTRRCRYVLANEAGDGCYGRAFVQKRLSLGMSRLGVAGVLRRIATTSGRTRRATGVQVDDDARTSSTSTPGARRRIRDATEPRTSLVSRELCVATTTRPACSRVATSANESAASVPFTNR